MRRDNKSWRAFALYEVLLGLTVFVVGVLALGRSVENCLNASILSAEDNRIRLVLANRMSEIQATPSVPDPSKETKIDTGYGVVRLTQQTVPAQLTEDDGTDLVGISTVTLTADWVRDGVKQVRTLEFYVYRPS
jgi:Tfp pilus assembly protein PilV